MQLAHARDDGLARFFVGTDSEGRVFSGKTGQCQSHFFLIGLGFGFYRLSNHGVGEGNFLQNNRGMRVAQGLARAHVLQAYAGRNIACADFFDFLAGVGMHLHDAANALLFAANRVVNQITLGQHAGVHAHKGQLPDKRVGHELEGQGCEFFIVAGMAHQCGAGIVVFAVSLYGRYIQRRGHEFDDGIQQPLHASVLEGGAAEHGLNLGRYRAQAQARDDVLRVQVAGVQVFFGQGFRGFGRGFYHLLPPLAGAGLQGFRNVLIFKFHAL